MNNSSSSPGQTPPGRNPGDEAEPGTPQTGEAPCPVCAGTGKLGQESCGNCGGSGVVIKNVGDA